MFLKNYGIFSVIFVFQDIQQNPQLTRKFQQVNLTVGIKKLIIVKGGKFYFTIHNRK